MTELAPLSGVPHLSKYELIEEIGHGGMATVYRAKDRRLGREVAVKIIHKHLRENAEVDARFIAEARAAAKLRHPGIVEVYDVSTEDDAERFLVVELIRGATLRKVLQQHREMPAEIGAAIVLALCEALEHAHAASIIHRDIKPENVLVELPADRANITPTPPLTRVRRSPDESGAMPAYDASGRGPRPVSASDPVMLDGGKPERESSRRGRAADTSVVIKLTDFGIAKILDAQGVTSTGQVLGSPAHMAPEQIEGGDVDARTDVFGLGVLMYECLVGHLPFEGKNPAQVLRKVLEGIYAAVDRERPKVGGRWSRIVAQALALDPAARTASPAALGEQISAELAALEITDPSAEISAYFADPTGYTEALSRRLIPGLVARAEAARKAGDMTGAAADFDRALAFCPNDVVLMRRIGNLHGAAGRRLLLRRVGAIAVGSAVLGCAAFGLARAWKARAARSPEGSLGGEAAPTASSSVAPSPARSAAIVAVAEPASSGGATAGGGPGAALRQMRVGAIGAAAPSASALAGAPSGTRNVRFVVTPQGAKLEVDGMAVNWFGGSVALGAGPHHVKAFMAGSRCCKTLETNVAVQPSDRADDIQTIQLTMEILPASVTLAGAPPNGQYSCPGINLSGFPGSTVKVKLSEPVWGGKCQFTTSTDRPARSAAVILKAGETNAIAWPASE